MRSTAIFSFCLYCIRDLIPYLIFHISRWLKLNVFLSSVCNPHWYLQPGTAYVRLLNPNLLVINVTGKRCDLSLWCAESCNGSEAQLHWVIQGTCTASPVALPGDNEEAVMQRWTLRHLDCSKVSTAWNKSLKHFTWKSEHGDNSCPLAIKLFVDCLCLIYHECMQKNLTMLIILIPYMHVEFIYGTQVYKIYLR